MSTTEESIVIANQKVTLQIGKLAQASNVAIFAQMGETCILATVNIGSERDIDYLPLQVEYVEKLYAGGRIKGSRWVKREGRPSDGAILKARLIDRSIRPLFPKNFHRDIQVIITLLSVDGINSPEILSAIVVSAALHLSSIPWEGPISTMRIGFVKNDHEGTFVINPTEDDQQYSVLDLVVSSTKEKVVMIEVKGEEIPEQIILQGLKKAKEENLKIIKFIENLRQKSGLPKERENSPLYNEKIASIIKKDFKNNLNRLILRKAEKEFGNEEGLEVFVEEVYNQVKGEFEKQEIVKVIDYLSNQLVKEKVLKTKKRVDGRSADQIRDIDVEVSVLPRTHGSAIFQRGDTQVLSIVTLGTPHFQQLIESPEGEEAKRYIHHYYMPPYSLGEVGRIGFPSRREIGHGALAEKALEPVLPAEKEFPYTIRVVSEVLSSNGSTSMAATCGSTLALMDAGVPIKAPVAGVAMGLMAKTDNDYMILTDIAGIEDFAGEMDFKIAGTQQGITAIQLDVKNMGLTDKIISETLEKARVARLFILGKIKKIIEKPRKEISRFAPQVIVFSVPLDKIGEVIGPGGKNIRSLIAKTETEIDIDDQGKVTISGIDRKKVQEAASMIKNITREVSVGEIFIGEVKRILPFGAFVEFLPGKEGMIHVSKLGVGFVRDPGKIVRIGQRVKVRVFQIDNQGRINLQLISKTL